MLKDYLNLPEINMRALVTCCYTAGAGAIGFFMRWIQKQIAFTDENLVDPSFWNIMLPFFMVICAYVAYNHIRNMYDDGYSVPDTITPALSTEGSLATFLSCFFGFLMFIGGVILIAQCETDKNVSLLRVVAAFGMVSGICHPVLIRLARRNDTELTEEAAAKRAERKNRLCCITSFIPILHYCIWLLASYKANDINPVVWSYSIELITVCICVVAYFRIAGLAYAAPKGKKTLFSCMAAFYMCFMSLADARYLGMQIMNIATGLIMLLYLWILVENFDFTAPEYIDIDDGGFENLNGKKKKRRIR